MGFTPGKPINYIPQTPYKPSQTQVKLNKLDFLLYLLNEHFSSIPLLDRFSVVCQGSHENPLYDKSTEHHPEFEPWNPDYKPETLVKTPRRATLPLWP